MHDNLRNDHLRSTFHKKDRFTQKKIVEFRTSGKLSNRE